MSEVHLTHANDIVECLTLFSLASPNSNCDRNQYLYLVNLHQRLSMQGGGGMAEFNNNRNGFVINGFKSK